MEWLRVANSMKEIGVSVVCCAIFAVIAYRMFKMFKMQQDKLFNKLIDGINNHTLSKEENEKISKIEAEIQNILKESLYETQSARVSFVRYHNGGRGLNRLSFLKMSMTNEVVKIGVQPFMPEFQNQFRAMFSYWTNEIDTKGYCNIENIEDLKIKDTSMYEFLKTRNIQAEFGIGIKNEENTTIGFICIEFLDKDNVSKEKVIKSLQNKKIKLETLLHVSDERGEMK